RLSDGEIALIADWADAGGPLGEESSAAELPTPPSFGLDDPDAIYEPHTPWTTSVFGETEDEFICFAIDPELEENAYITAFEVIPGDLSVVHHVL
ncbi:MAG: hypothetical protein QGG40_01790, partial [Myxococcota bacterium]|nr:hypothetical protein [Myxococcota bacterium]